MALYRRPGSDEPPGENSEEYCGEEHRVAERRACPMDGRLTEIERTARRTAVEVKHITECLNGYRGFIEVLKKREEQKVKLRDRLIERGIAAVLFSIAGAVLMLVWAGIVQWLKDMR